MKIARTATINVLFSILTNTTAVVKNRGYEFWIDNDPTALPLMALSGIPKTFKEMKIPMELHLAQGTPISICRWLPRHKIEFLSLIAQNPNKYMLYMIPAKINPGITEV
jgi:hypothetical protein